MPNRTRSPDKKSQKERIKEITDQLEAGIQELFESDKFKDYLHLFFLGKTKMGIEPAVITPWLLQDLNYINFSDTMSAVNCDVSMPV